MIKSFLPSSTDYIDDYVVTVIVLLSLNALFSSLIVLMLAVLAVLWCRIGNFYKLSVGPSSTKQLNTETSKE